MPSTLFAASVVNVVPDVEQVLAEMHRIYAPGGAVSVLVLSTEFTDEDLGILIESLGLTGFSRAALEKWHRSATKTSRTLSTSRRPLWYVPQ